MDDRNEDGARPTIFGRPNNGSAQRHCSQALHRVAAKNLAVPEALDDILKPDIIPACGVIPLGNVAHEGCFVDRCEWPR
jgi:hypothetical protein